MKTKYRTSTFRIPEDIANEAAEILSSTGISLNAFLTMATYQLVNQRKIPFDIIPARSALNEQTQRALIEAQARELGLIQDDSPAFDDVESLMRHLEGAQ